MQGDLIKKWLIVDDTRCLLKGNRGANSQQSLNEVLASMLHEKQGDAFAPRNHFALNIDDEVDPPMFKISDTHYAATWLLDPRAPKVEMPPELAQRIERMRAEAEKIKEAE